MGLKDIEALLMSAYRHKVTLLSPNRLHKHFGISHKDYEERKEAVVQIAAEHLSHLQGFSGQVRQHDMADAACMCIYHLTKIKEERRRKERLENIKNLFLLRKLFLRFVTFYIFQFIFEMLILCSYYLLLKYCDKYSIIK